jgi:hypothetical protein
MKDFTELVIAAATPGMRLSYQMEVTSGASWSSPSGMRQWAIALNESDGEQLSPEWSSLSWPERRVFLQKRADILVLKYMHDNRAISDEFFSQRMNEIAKS